MLNEAQVLDFKKIASDSGLHPKTRRYALRAISALGEEPLLDFIRSTRRDDRMQEYAARLVDRIRQGER